MGEQKRRAEAVVAGVTRGCGGCAFFKRIRIGQPGGFCRARPPSVLMVGMGEGFDRRPIPVVNTYWPQVPDTEWCGEWGPKLDLTAIDPEALQNAEMEGTA